MAWMKVFTECNLERKNSRVGFNAKPQPVPQEFPRDFVDYAVGMGFAEEVPSPTREAKRAMIGAKPWSKKKGQPTSSDGSSAQGE